MKIPEIFERTTLKRLDAIYDVEEHKTLVRTYIEYGEWFTVAGLRRTGKTTLVRSVVASLGLPSVYINLWELSPYEISIKSLMGRLIEKINGLFGGRMRSLTQRIKEVNLLGLKLSFSMERPDEALTEIIERIIKKRRRFIIILDEVQELEQDLSKLIMYLGALHDLFAPNLTVVLLGSIVSLKNILERIRGVPTRGRITHEIILKPFDTEKALGFLKKGFTEVGLALPEETLIRIVEFLGGFPGWLAEYGRLFIETYKNTGETPKPDTVLHLVFNEAKNMVYEEMAKLVSQRRKLLNYIKILRYIATNMTATPKEVAELLKTTRQAAYKYLKYLRERAIIEAKNGKYYILDPLIRRAMTQPDAEDQILLRLKKYFE